MNPLTRDFGETVKARAEADPEFRRLLLLGVLELLMAGEVGAAKVLLRDVLEANELEAGQMKIAEKVVERDAEALEKLGKL